MVLVVFSPIPLREFVIQVVAVVVQAALSNGLENASNSIYYL